MVDLAAKYVETRPGQLPLPGPSVSPVQPYTGPSFKVGESRLVDQYIVINALTEQDSVASLKYGVLLLLALSSLGVYRLATANRSRNIKHALASVLRFAPLFSQ